MKMITKQHTNTGCPIAVETQSFTVVSNILDAQNGTSLILPF